MVCLFCAYNITGDKKNFFKILTVLVSFKINLNLNEILNLTCNSDSTEKADHILEIPGLGAVCVVIVTRIMQKRVD